MKIKNKKVEVSKMIYKKDLVHLMNTIMILIVIY